MARRDEDMERQVSRQSQRLQKAERERRTLLAETAFVGSLGLLFVLPVVAGAYLGRWLDSLASGYSIRWTLSLIIVGICLGGFNVYRNIKDSDQ